MRREADLVISKLEKIREEEIYGFKFYFGNLTKYVMMFMDKITKEPI